jgi:hypothetical protein
MPPGGRSKEQVGGGVTTLGKAHARLRRFDGRRVRNGAFFGADNADFGADLRSLPASSLRPLPGFDIATEAGHRTTNTARRITFDLAGIAAAAKYLDRLPAEGESFHGITRGKFNGWHLVEAVLKLAAPAVIHELYLTTFGITVSHGQQLMQLIDAGQVGRVTILANSYGIGTRKGRPSFQFLCRELAARPGGHRVAAVRSHAKVILFGLSDGRRITSEGSANLTAYRNIEQIVLTGSRDVYEFHAGWINSLLRQHQ